MKKHHALALSLLLAAAAVAGVVALTRTVALGQRATATPTADVARREAALDRARHDIARLDANVPPALPPVTAPTRAAASRVVVVRSAGVAAAGEEGREEHEHGESDDELGWEAEHEEDGWDD